MASKILLLSIFVLSFNEMAAKPVANKKKTAQSHINEGVLKNTVHQSKFTNYLKETPSNEQSPYLERNIRFKRDEDKEDVTNQEADEMNESLEDIDQIKYNFETDMNDGGDDEETYNEDKGYRTQSIDLDLWGNAASQDNFQKEALIEHNYYRRLHGARALTLNKAMSESAANYAKTLVLLGSMDHSKQTERPNQGENLFMECSKSNLPKPHDAIEKWYDEVCGYNFQESNSNLGKVTGHFTQLVWKPTKEFGIGYAIGVNTNDPGMKCTYVVARYKPAGNILGRFLSSVGRRFFGKYSTCSKKSTEMPMVLREPEENSDKDAHGMKSEVAGPEQSDDDNMNVPIDPSAEMLEAPVVGTTSLVATNGSPPISRHSGDNVADVPVPQEFGVAPPTTDSGDISADMSSVQDLARTPAKVNGVTGPSGQGTSAVVASPSGINDAQAAPVSSTVTAPSADTAASTPGSNVVTPTSVTSYDPAVAPISQASYGNPVVSIKPKREESLKEFQLDLLKRHNSFRIRHESKLLNLDANLNSDAASYARQLAKEPPVKGAFRLLPSGIGQNTYSQCGKSVSGADVTNVWYNEICKTGFLEPVILTQRAAQFIQVVWKESTSIGVSFALGMDSTGKLLCTHVVVLYKPGAIHDFKTIDENVKPGSFDAKVHCRQLSNLGGSIAQQRVAQPLPTGTPTKVAQQPVTATPTNVPPQILTGRPPKPAQPPFTGTTTNVAQGTTVTPPKVAQQPVTATPTNVAQPTLTGRLAQQPIAGTPTNVARQGTAVASPKPAPTALAGTLAKPAQQPVAGTPMKVAQLGTVVASPKVAPTALTGTPLKVRQQAVTATSTTVAQQGPTVTPPKPAPTALTSNLPKPAQQLVTATPPKVAQQGITVTSPKPTLPTLTGIPTNVAQGTTVTPTKPARTALTGTPPNLAQQTIIGTPPNPAQQGPTGTSPTVPSTTSTTQIQGNPTVNAVAASSSGVNGAGSYERKPTSVPTASQTDDDFERKALEQHNIFRKRHGAESLTLDRQLCKEAKEYAKKLSKRGPDKQPQHSQQASRIDQGENLFVGCNANIDSADITRIWYNEVCHYDFTTYQSTGVAPIGHFTQIVWKGSKKFGIAREFRGDSQTGCAFVVARYSPMKAISQVVDNIDKGRFSPSVCRVESKNGKGAILAQRTEQFIDDALGAHNEYRLVHGVSPLVNDKELNEAAQKYAKKLARKSINDVAMSKTLGESIYTSCDGVVTGRSTTEAWYWDVCNYDFTLKKSKDGIADHFTQLVWKGSTNVGFGAASGIEDGKTCVFVVARYFLPGNIAGQNKFNVFKGRFNEKQCEAHALPSSQAPPASTVVLSSDGSPVNADGTLSPGTSNVDDDTVTADESPDTSTDGTLTSQLDITETPMISDGTVPTVTATVTSSTSSAIANKPASVTAGKLPTVIGHKLPMVTTNAPPFVTSSGASTPVSPSGSKQLNTGPSKEIFGSSKTKTQPVTATLSPTGALPSTGPSKQLNTGPTKQIFDPSTIKTQPVTAPPSTTGALSSTGPSKEIFGPSTTKTQTNTVSALTPTGVTSGLTPSKSPTPENSGEVPSSTTTQQPTTETSTSGVLPLAGAIPGSIPVPTQTTTTGSVAVALGLSSTPAKGVLGVSATNNQPARTTPNIAGTQPNSNPTSGAGSSSGTTLTSPSKVSLGTTTTATKPAVTSKQLATTSTSTLPTSGTLHSVTGSSGSVTTFGGGTPLNTGPSKQILRPVTTNKQPTPMSTNTPSLTGTTSGLPPFPSTTPGSPSGSPSIRPVIPVQNGINLNKNLYPNIECKISRGFVNDIDEINSENTWPAPDSSLEMNEPMSFKDINNYNQDDMYNDDNDDDMNETYKHEPMEETGTQSNEFNGDTPTSKPDSSSAEQPTDSLKIHQQMVHPWGNQHSKYQYRNQDFLANEKYLSDKVTGTFQHDQQNKGWSFGKKLGHYDDAMDLMGSDMTWDEGVEGGNGDISSTYKDLDYGDIEGDFKRPYGAYEDTYGGNKGMVSTYKDPSGDGNIMNMYKELDSKTYPKKSQSYEDNMGLIDTSVEGDSEVLGGFHSVNGMSSEGGVGLPVKGYADELGQSRELSKSSQAKRKGKKNIKNNNKVKRKTRKSEKQSINSHKERKVKRVILNCQFCPISSRYKY